MAARARIGTSGFVYEHWWETFYPEDLPAKDRLAYYAARFDTVEVNNTFYRMPSPDALRAWLDVVPERFAFAFKAHRYITHRKKLVDVGGSLDVFLERLEPIATRIDVLLFQLPPFLGFDPERLDAFLGLLPEGRPYRYAFEFRHPAWNNEQTYEILASRNVAYCIHDFEQEPVVRTTADGVYVRFHGPEGPYRGLYRHDVMQEWSRRIAAWLREGRDVWAYFNNDQLAYATRNAAELRGLVDAEMRGGRARGAATAA